MHHIHTLWAWLNSGLIVNALRCTQKVWPYVVLGGLPSYQVNVLERYLEQTRFEEATRGKRRRSMKYNFVSVFWMEAMSVQTSPFQHHFCFDPVAKIPIGLAERVKWRIHCWIADWFRYCWLQVFVSFLQTTFWPIFSFTTIFSHLFLETISQYLLFTISLNIFVGRILFHFNSGPQPVLERLLWRRIQAVQPSLMSHLKLESWKSWTSPGHQHTFESQSHFLFSATELKQLKKSYLYLRCFKILIKC